MCCGLVIEGLISLKRVFGIGGAVFTLQDFLSNLCRWVDINPNAAEMIFKPRAIASFTLYMNEVPLVL